MDDQSNRIQNSHILETDHTENQQPERISTAREITSPLHDAKPSEDKVGDKAGDRPIISSPNASNLSYSQIYTTKQSDADSSVNKKLEEERKLRQSTTEVPDMLSWPFIGLYCQYAAVGLLFGSGSIVPALCFYSFDGQPNLCANSIAIVNFAWSLKLFFAVFTDMYQPFGMRRRPWMIFGWTMVLILLLSLSITASSLETSTWLAVLVLVQFFMMFSDVPGDGYTVEIGKIEPQHRRGLTLATAQMIRFSFSIVAGFIQAFLMNGPTTNPSDCQVSFNGCWAFGLTVNQYYGLLFAMIFIITIPIFWLQELPQSEDFAIKDLTIPMTSVTEEIRQENKSPDDIDPEMNIIEARHADRSISMQSTQTIELDDENHLQEGPDSINSSFRGQDKSILLPTTPKRWIIIKKHKSVSYFIDEIWRVLQNKTTFNMMIFVIGAHSLTNLPGPTISYMKFYIIKLSNFQIGIDSITTNIALVTAVYVFKTYLINYNWRRLEYIATIGPALMGFVWILVYYDIGGLMNGWFAIFVDIDQTFVTSLTQVLYSVASIEVCKAGLEATTYEIITTVANAGLQIAAIVAVQLLSPLGVTACFSDTDDYTCPPDSVDLSSKQTFEASDGPRRFSIYTITLCCVCISGALIFVPFLPKSKEECHEWREKGEKSGLSRQRGIMAVCLCVVAVLYGFTVASLLLSPSTSCLQLVGGKGC